MLRGAREWGQRIRPYPELVFNLKEHSTLPPPPWSVCKQSLGCMTRFTPKKHSALVNTSYASNPNESLGDFRGETTDTTIIDEILSIF